MNPELEEFDRDDTPQDGLVNRALRLASIVHRGERHGAGVDYIEHCIRVAERLRRLYPADAERIASGLLHDVMEAKPSLTHGDLIQRFTPRVADIVEACTGRGSNRKSRNIDWLAKLVAYPDAIPTKLADRDDNGEASEQHDPQRFRMYQKEWPVFRDTLRPSTPDTICAPLWESLHARFETPAPR